MVDTRNVVVQSQVRTTAAAAEDISTLLVIDTNHSSFSRVQTFTNDDYVAGTQNGTKLRAALGSAFKPEIKPAIVLAGRSKGTAVITPQSIADGVVYEFDLTTKQGDSVSVSYTTSPGDLADDVCTGIKSDIDAVTAVTDHVTATIVGVGADATLEISLVSTSDDYIIEANSENLGISYRTTEAPADLLQAIRDFNDDFTYVVHTDHTVSFQNSLDSACQIAEKFYFTSTQEAAPYTAEFDIQNAPASDDIGGLLVFKGSTHGHVMFYHTADTTFPEAARVTTFTQLEPGTSSYQVKNIGFGIAQNPEEGRGLSVAELIRLKSRNMSTVINVGGRPVIGAYEGNGARMADGTQIWVRVWSKYAQQSVQRAITTVLLNKNALGLTNPSDLNLIRSAGESWLQTQVTSPAGKKAIRTRESMPNNESNYRIVFPDPKNASFEDQADGILRASEAVVYLDASIDQILIVPLTITYANGEV